MAAHGPMLTVLGGAGISWLIGFVVTGAGYLVSSRLAFGPVIRRTAGVRDTVT